MIFAIFICAIYALTAFVIAATISRLCSCSMREGLFVSGVAFLVAFIVCVQIPYYFLGYAEIVRYEPLEVGLGYTKYLFVDAFALLLSDGPMGILWLMTSALLIAHGQANAYIRHDLALKCLLYVYIYLTVFDYRKYQVIGSVLN